jgi:hypothetical protein
MYEDIDLEEGLAVAHATDHNGNTHKIIKRADGSVVSVNQSRVPTSLSNHSRKTLKIGNAKAAAHLKGVIKKGKNDHHLASVLNTHGDTHYHWKPGRPGSSKREDVESNEDISFFSLRERVRSADKKPEKYTTPDGKVKTRMVAVDKDIKHKRKGENGDKENTETEMEEGHRNIAVTKQGETFKSGVHATKKKADDQHYKMSKSGNFKKITTVKTEGFLGGDFVASAEKSKIGPAGHRPHLINSKGKTSYLGSQSYKKRSDAVAHAKHYHSVMHKPTSAIDRHMAKYSSDNKHKLATEETEVNEISNKLAHSYLAGKKERDYEKIGDHTYKTKKPKTFDQMRKDGASTRRALVTIKRNNAKNPPPKRKVHKDILKLQNRKEETVNIEEGMDKDNEFHVAVHNGKFQKSQYGDKNKKYLHDTSRKGGDGKTHMLATFRHEKHAKQAAKKHGGQVQRTHMGSYRVHESIEFQEGKKLQKLARKIIPGEGQRQAGNKADAEAGKAGEKGLATIMKRNGERIMRRKADRDRYTKQAHQHLKNSIRLGRVAAGQKPFRKEDVNEVVTTDKLKAQMAARKAARANAQRRSKAAASKPKPAPKPAGTAARKGTQKDRTDTHVVMQLRKAQDVGGNTHINYHKGPKGKLAGHEIDTLLKFHNHPKVKPDHKRMFRVATKTHASTQKFAAALKKAGF